MAFDRQDIEEFGKTQRKPGADEASRLRMIQQSAVRSDQMTGDPAWDTYLSYVQAQIDGLKKSRDDFRVRLASPQMVNQDQISLVRISLIRADDRIAALEWAIQLPSLIKKMGVIAQEQLDEISRLEVQQENAA